MTLGLLDTANSAMPTTTLFSNPDKSGAGIINSAKLRGVFPPAVRTFREGRRARYSRRVSHNIGMETRVLRRSGPVKPRPQAKRHNVFSERKIWLASASKSTAQLGIPEQHMRIGRRSRNL